MSNIEKCRELGVPRNVGRQKALSRYLVDADTKKILGATIVGIDGDEIIHSLLDVMYANKSYPVISPAVHIHPTIYELIPTILQNLKPLNN